MPNPVVFEFSIANSRRFFVRDGNEYWCGGYFGNGKLASVYDSFEEASVEAKHAAKPESYRSARYRTRIAQRLGFQNLELNEWFVEKRTASILAFKAPDLGWKRILDYEIPSFNDLIRLDRLRTDWELFRRFTSTRYWIGPFINLWKIATKESYALTVPRIENLVGQIVSRIRRVDLGSELTKLQRIRQILQEPPIDSDLILVATTGMMSSSKLRRAIPAWSDAVAELIGLVDGYRWIELDAKFAQIEELLTSL